VPKRRARAHHLPPDHAIGVGVDRLDYTKGIEERLRAVERFLRCGRNGWAGSRSSRLARRRAAASGSAGVPDTGAIVGGAHQQAFARAAHPPVVLKAEHHEPQAVYDYFRAADLCFVSSLHDGMNLVAKSSSRRATTSVAC
jgi:trehalose 6-phosphate synthase